MFMYDNLFCANLPRKQRLQRCLSWMLKTSWGTNHKQFLREKKGSDMQGKIHFLCKSKPALSCPYQFWLLLSKAQPFLFIQMAIDSILHVTPEQLPQNDCSINTVLVCTALYYLGGKNDTGHKTMCPTFYFAWYIRIEDSPQQINKSKFLNTYPNY